MVGTDRGTQQAGGMVQPGPAIRRKIFPVPGSPGHPLAGLPPKSVS
jgi:hypothetical protein